VSDAGISCSPVADFLVFPSVFLALAFCSLILKTGGGGALVLAPPEVAVVVTVFRRRICVGSIVLVLGFVGVVCWI
jgi:hypothetical protein